MRSHLSSILSVCLVISLSGCALFAPAFDKVLADKSTSAFENVSRLAANIELGSYSEPASYTAASELYVDVQAELSVASLRAGTLPISGRGTSAAARDDLVGFINGCKAQVESTARLHRSEGLQPAAGASQSMLVVCDQAARAARAME